MSWKGIVGRVSILGDRSMVESRSVGRRNAHGGVETCL